MEETPTKAHNDKWHGFHRPRLQEPCLRNKKRSSKQKFISILTFFCVDFPNLFFTCFLLGLFSPETLFDCSASDRPHSARRDGTLVLELPTSLFCDCFVSVVDLGPCAGRGESSLCVGVHGRWTKPFRIYGTAFRLFSHNTPSLENMTTGCCDAFAQAGFEVGLNKTHWSFLRFSGWWTSASSWSMPHVGAFSRIHPLSVCELGARSGGAVRHSKNEAQGVFSMCTLLLCSHGLPFSQRVASPRGGYRCNPIDGFPEFCTDEDMTSQMIPFSSCKHRFGRARRKIRK